jgi:hypothetical protein
MYLMYSRNPLVSCALSCPPIADNPQLNKLTVLSTDTGLPPTTVNPSASCSTIRSQREEAKELLVVAAVEAIDITPIDQNSGNGDDDDQYSSGGYSYKK